MRRSLVVVQRPASTDWSTWRVLRLTLRIVPGPTTSVVAQVGDRHRARCRPTRGARSSRGRGRPSARRPRAAAGRRRASARRRTCRASRPSNSWARALLTRNSSRPSRGQRDRAVVVVPDEALRVHGPEPLGERPVVEPRLVAVRRRTERQRAGQHDRAERRGGQPGPERQPLEPQEDDAHDRQRDAEDHRRPAAQRDDRRHDEHQQHGPREEREAAAGGARPRGEQRRRARTAARLRHRASAAATDPPRRTAAAPS